MDRLSIDAVIIGLAIGLGAILLETWFGTADWPVRIIALLVMSAILCAAQYWLIKLRRR